ncbi:MAG: CPBP family intramembrane glutamic endopeptidase [Candidatus Latescibacterota bacterium]
MEHLATAYPAESGLPAGRVTPLVRRHSVPLFFALAFAFSWIIYLIIYLVQIEQPTVLSRWCLIAAFGPSLAAMAVSRLTDSRRVDRPVLWRPLFALFFVFAAGVEALDHFVFAHTVTTQLIIADGVLVLLAAIVLSGVVSPNAGIRNLLNGLKKWDVGIWWYVLALGVWPATVLLSNLLSPFLGMASSPNPTYPAFPLGFVVAESFLWYLLFGGPLNEEAGWRAFALTRMQERFSPLTASIIIGALWGLWHLPLHLMGMYPFGAAGAVIRIFSIPLAIVFTWLFNRTGGSLIPVLFLHSSRNTTSLFLSRNFIVSEMLFVVFAAVVVVKDKMWRRAE